MISDNREIFGCVLGACLIGACVLFLLLQLTEIGWRGRPARGKVTIEIKALALKYIRSNCRSKSVNVALPACCIK